MTVSNRIRTCVSIFKIKTAEEVQYRLAYLSGVAVGIIWVILEVVLYTAFFHFSDGSWGASEMTLGQVISYSWIGQVIFVMHFYGIDGDIKSKINNGDIGIELCRPIKLYDHWYFKSAGGKIVPLLYRGVPTLLIGILIPGRFGLLPPESVEGLIASLISLAAAFMLCISFGMFVIAIRMKISLGDGPIYMLMLISGVLSGGYLPLQLWPDFMQKFLLYQPFSGVLDIPIRLYIGSMAPTEAWSAITLQVVWTLLFIAAGKMLMKRRLNQIVVQGG